MNNAAFTAELSSRIGRDLNETARLVKSFVDTLTEEWTEGNVVNIQGFGTFEVKKKAERISVNPVSGKRMLVPPKLTLGFKPSNALKEKFRHHNE